MKKELLVQLFLVVGGLFVVLFAVFFLRSDDPVLVHDEALADWLELEDYSVDAASGSNGDADDLDPLVRMTPVPGSETEYE